MHIVVWETELAAPWKRDLDLVEVALLAGGLHVGVKDPSGNVWSFDFSSAQAWRFTSEEFAGRLIASLPTEGSLFQIQGSEWIAQLAIDNDRFQSKHYVICCYDDVIEVLAEDCSVNPVL